MTYTGDVQPGGPPDVRELPELDDQQAVGRPDGQQRLPPALPGHRRRRAGRRGRTSRTGCSTSSATARLRARRHHPPPRRPLAGARRGRRGHRRPGRAPTPWTRRRAAGAVDRTVDARRHGRGRRRCTLAVIHLRGHTPGSDRAAATTTRAAHPHLFTGDSLFPGGAGKTAGAGGFTSLMDDLRAARLRHAARTRPGSTPATATTPPSAPSARTSANGATAAGDRGRPSAQVRSPVWARPCRPPGDDPERSGRAVVADERGRRAVRGAPRDTVSDFYQRVIVEPGRAPLLFLFTAFIVTFLFTRLSVRMIRAGVSWWPGNVTPGGVHIHHAVFGAGADVDQRSRGVHSGRRQLAVVADPRHSLRCRLPRWCSTSSPCCCTSTTSTGRRRAGRRSTPSSSRAVGDRAAAARRAAARASTTSGRPRNGPGARRSPSWSVNAILVLITFLKGKSALGILGLFIPFVALVGAIRLGRSDVAVGPMVLPGGVAAPASAPTSVGSRRKSRQIRFKFRIFDVIAGRPDDAVARCNAAPDADARHSRPVVASRRRSRASASGR